MDEIGFHISLADYRLLFDQIDFDEAGDIDFFKFCLLDYNKVALREKLIQQHQLSLVSKSEQSQVYNKNKKINNTKSLDAANKNKDVNKFMESVQ